MTHSSLCAVSSVCAVSQRAAVYYCSMLHFGAWQAAEFYSVLQLVAACVAFCCGACWSV